MNLMSFSGSSTPRPEVTLRFTETSVMADVLSRCYLLQEGFANVAPFLAQDCQFNNARMDIYSSASGMTIALTNNLLRNCSITWDQPTNTNSASYCPLRPLWLLQPISFRRGSGYQIQLRCYTYPHISSTLDYFQD